MYSCDQKIADESSEYIKEVVPNMDKSFTFIYLTHVDETGHEKTWCSKEYYSAVRGIDKQVNTLVPLCIYLLNIC